MPGLPTIGERERETETEETGRDRESEREADKERGEPIPRSSLGKDLMYLRVTCVSTACTPKAKVNFVQTAQSESCFGLPRSYLLTARQENMITPLKTFSVRSAMGVLGWNLEKI